MKKSIILIAFLIASTYSFAQQNEPIAKSKFLQAKKYYEYIKYDSAITLYKQAAEIFNKSKNKDEYFNCQIGIGQCIIKKNEPAKALDFFTDLLKKSEKEFGKNKAIAATCIYYQGFANLNLNKMEVAENLIKKSLDLRITLFGENHIDVAQSYNLMGQYFLMKGDYSKSLDNFNKSLTIREKVSGENSLDVAHSMDNISSAFYYQGFTDTAIYFSNKSLKIKEQILPQDHPDYILNYNALSVYQNEKKNYDVSLGLNLKNLTLCEKYYGHLHPTTALIYRNIGQNYLKLKNFDKSLNYYQESIKISKSINKNDNTDLAAAHIAVGDLYDETCDYDKAIKIKKNALDIMIKTNGEAHPNTALAYNSLGISLQKSGNFAQAIAKYELALSIFNQSQGETNANSAMCLVNIGNVYLETGQNEMCLKYYKQALSIYQKLFGEDSFESTALYNNMGELYNSMGEYEKALGFFNKLKEINEKNYGTPSVEMAMTYKNIGNCYEFMGNPAKAIPLYQQALNICVQSVGEKDLSTAIVYENLGKAYQSINDLDNAKTNAEKALDIRRDLLHRKHYLNGFSYINLGSINYQMGNCLESLLNYEFAIESNLIGYTPAGINYARVPEIRNYIDLNSILAAFKGKLMAFLALYEKEKVKVKEDQKNQYLRDVLDHIKACDNTIDMIRKSSVEEKDKLQVSANSIAVYDLAIQFCYLVYLDTKDEQYLERAFYYAEKSKAGSLLEAMAGAEAQKFANIPDSIISMEKQLDREIADLRKQQAEGRYGDIEDKIFKLENEKQSLIKLCEIKYPKYFQLKYADKLPEIKDIQATLDDNTALVSYYQTEKFIFQIVMTNKKFSFSSDYKFEDFDKKLEDFRYSIIHGDSKSNIEKYKVLGNEFYKLLFHQYIDKQINNLIIVPAGNLANIPFEALLTSIPTEKQKFKDLPYLINKYNISYAYSANLYYLTSARQKQDRIEVTQINDWLAFAPVFSDETTSGMSIRSRSLLKQINESADTLKTRGALLNGNYVSPLPGTEYEVKSIFDAFNNQNKKAIVKFHQAANEAFAKSDELKKYKYIHFATHGFVDSEKPELSGILLAQDTTGGNDGILFSGEIYNLELNADLVVLSACETGLGKIQSGEGIIGLSRALLYAGAKNIIVSLWQVADEATSELMLDFYSEKLKSGNQQTFSEFLRNAKLKMIKEGKFSHPFFWSPFVLIGK